MNKIYVTTCPSYMEIARVWIYLCNKFWKPNPKIILLGNGKCTIPLPNNATFVDVGNNTDKNMWCKNMGDYFDSINEEYIAYTMEDCWISKPVDTNQLTKIYDEVKRLDIDRTYINRSHFDLPKIRQHCRDPKSIWGKNSNILYAKDPHNYYFISMHASIWKRNRFVELCRICNTPWEMEVEGSVYARGNDFRCGIPHGPSPLIQTEVVVKFREPGGPNHLHLSTMPKDVLTDLKENGYLDHWIKNGTMDITLE